MNYFTIGFFLAIVAVIGMVAMTARIALSENSKVSNRIREALRRVRMFKMLQKRRVDVQSYLQTTDVSEIRQHIATCGSCSSTQACETALGSQETAINDYSFCPNSAAIERLRSSTSEVQNEPQPSAIRC